MERRYTIEIEPDEEGTYVATVPSVPGVAEQGDTADEAYERISKALTFHLECMEEDGEELPPSDYSRREVRHLEFAG